MMAKETEKFIWETRNWLNQLLFFIAGIAFFSIGKGHGTDGVWLYLGVNTVLLFIGLGNILGLKGSIRYFTSLTIIVANTFILPLSFYSYTGNLSYGVGASLIYVVLTFMISPYLVSSAALISAVAFASYLDYDKNVFEKYPVFKQQIAELNKDNMDIEKNIESKVKYHIVTPKDTNLKAISALEDVYGNPDYWFTIYQANKNIMKEPTQELQPGVKLVIPLSKGIPYKIKYYTVKRETSLQTISSYKEVYNSKDDWPYLFEANKSKLRDPQLLVLAGTVLIVPELPKTPYTNFFRIALAYLLAAATAFLWRIFIGKMYKICMMALDKSAKTSSKEVDAIKKQLEITTNEYRLLKEEVALNILEMNKIVGFQKEYEQTENKK